MQEESEREIEMRIMCTVCLVWLRSSWPDGFHEQDLTPVGAPSAGTLLHPLPPFLHPIIPPLNTSSSLSVRSRNFPMI